MAEVIQSSGDMGSASAGSAMASPAVAGQQGQGQTSAQAATGSDTPGTQARPEPTVPPHRLREEADARRAAQEEARQLRAELAALAQRQAADAPLLDGMRKVFAPEPEWQPPADPLELEAKELRKEVDELKADRVARQRQGQVAQLQARIEKATATHPIPQYAVGSVVEAIRRFQQQGQVAPVEAIVKQVSEQIAEDRETYRKNRDVSPATPLMDRVAPNLPNMPKKFKTTQERMKRLSDNGTRH